MSKVIFDQNEIKELRKNINVQKVSEKSITYSDEFKRNFIEEYINGKSARTIFEKAGFRIDVIGIKRCEQAAYRWMKSYKKDGLVDLRDTRKENLGHTMEASLSKDKIIERHKSKIKLLEEQLEMLKKLDMSERRVVKKCLTLKSNDKFKLIAETISKNNYIRMIKYFCNLLNVSSSRYYNYLNSISIQQGKEHRDIETKNNILMAIDFRGYKKDSRNIKMILENEFNIIYNRKKIQRIMRKFKIICPIRKSNPYRKIAKYPKEHRVVPNILSRKFKQEIPQKVLLTDITYIKYGAGQTAYLSTVKDASTNMILDHKISDRITLDIAANTFKDLVKNHKEILHKESFIHSNQGAHYTSPIFQKLLKENKLRQSMSHRGNCWNNAPQESFFSHMKDEINFKELQSLTDVIVAIDEYLDYYNHHRCQ
ncbi:IS3 family transposase [Clostridium sp.]|uniref:IS3 family transposase n=1 Tax=Clostridium sp. TaxID=1506 RepID=UPI0039928727